MTNTDGTIYSSFATGTGLDLGTGHSVHELSNGQIIVGGQFSSYDGVSADNIILIEPNGSAVNTCIPPSPTPTTTPTPTPTEPASTELYIYAKWVNQQPSAADELEYQVNGGTWLSQGAPIGNSSCSYYNVLYGLSSGDVINFRTTYTTSLNYDYSDCPATASCVTPTITLVGGANYIYLTTDAGISC
jgi:hypothetical protein